MASSRPAVAVAATRSARRLVRADVSRLFAELDAKIEAGMTAYGVPGAAVGVVYAGREYLKGYGVTNVDHPRAVDPDTVFRVGSTTKVFTGTAVMRLVQQGKLDLNARVRRYLPEFRSCDPGVAARVTLGQLLRHTAGWLGNCFLDTGRGEDALARYVEGMVRLPQLTPPGTQFFYNNAGICLAGRLIEVVTGTSYEAAVRSLVLDPLRLSHSRFFSEEIIGFNIAASHKLEGEKPVVEPSLWELPRSLNSTGGLISSVRDQLAFARFHLGDGRAPGGKRLLTPRSLKRMRSHPGPGGTLVVELDGMGVAWQLRPSRQRVRIVQHGGDWPGQHSGLMIVPDRGFALTALTNSAGGPQLTQELFDDDWALRTFAGLSNLPAAPQVLSRRQLARYEGHYEAEMIAADGAVTKTVYELRADKGRLRVTSGSTVVARLAMYREDYALVLDESGRPQGGRCNFVRDAQRRIKWWWFQGALYRHHR